MKGQPSFKQVDITRALKAIRSCGVEIGTIEVDLKNGKLRVSAGAIATGDEAANAFDNWVAGNARKA